jgi:hypothetical protein
LANGLILHEEQSMKMCSGWMAIVLAIVKEADELFLTLANTCGCWKAAA